MRIVFWNCNMAFHRKYAAMAHLRADIAVISETAAPEVLAARGLDLFDAETCAWMGRNPNKGLGIFAFGPYRLHRIAPFHPTLRYVLPLAVTGPLSFGLMGVWAQNASAGPVRKHTLGPMRRALTKYRGFLQNGPVVVGGDLNNNVFWDKPGWRMNQAKAVATLEGLGLRSAYHAVTGEQQGEERQPTHYWRDRKKDGPVYHIDYAFVSEAFSIQGLEVCCFEDWVGAGLSDHVPLVLDVRLAADAG